MVTAVQAELVTEIGAIARVTFFAQDTGYTILQIEKDDFSTFTANGTMPDAAKGLAVELRGSWKVHPKYGKQFTFVSSSVPEPTGEAATIAFLSTLKCIGESVAKRIVACFGDDVFKIFDEGSSDLLKISGIGKKTLPKILESYQKTKGLRKLISFLSEVGVSAGYAPRIYKEYGEDAIAQVKQNPYILAEEVRGFGFKKADEVALAMGILPSSFIRFEAGIMHTLKSAASFNGHCFLMADDLAVQVCDVLALPDFRPQMNDVEGAIAALRKSSTGKSKRLVADGDRVYLYGMYQAEVELSKKLRQLAGCFEQREEPDWIKGLDGVTRLDPSNITECPESFDISDWIAKYELANGVTLAAGQRAAIASADANGLSVITGGAGVGKSTVSKAVIQYWHGQKMRVVAIAPTGKAAQRIREATGLSSASTIHRLLGWNGHGFNHNADNPLEGDAFLIDEASMMDLKLANSLFQAIPAHAVVMIVGDVNQLPSVGAGNVLRDIIECGQIPVIRLTEIFRQAATSRIIQASLAINEGKMPPLELLGRATENSMSDALWIKCSQGQIPDAIAWLLTDKLPAVGWEQDQIQVLSPMHKGESGNIALNAMIQRLWNPSERNKPSMGDFRVGDRIIQTANDYDKRVFNGDIGKIELIDLTEKEIKIRFPDLDNTDGRIVTYEPGDLDNLMLAYSISIHKSQGSEFPVVIIPASMQHYMMLQRNLYYTGVTRGKKLMVLVGEEKAIATAVRTQKLGQRNTALAERLAK